MKLASARELTTLVGLKIGTDNARRMERSLRSAGVAPVKRERRYGWMVNMYNEEAALRVLKDRPGQRYDNRAAVKEAPSKPKSGASQGDADVEAVRRLMARTAVSSPEQATADEWVTFADVLKMAGRGAGYSVKLLSPLLSRTGLMKYHKVTGEGARAGHLFLKSKVLEVVDSLRPHPYRRAAAIARAAAVERVSAIVSPPRIEKMPEAPQKCRTVEDYLKSTLETVQSLQKELRSLQAQVAPMVKATPGMLQLLGEIRTAICSSPLEPEDGVMVSANQGLSLDALVTA